MIFQISPLNKSLSSSRIQIFKLFDNLCAPESKVYSLKLLITSATYRTFSAVITGLIGKLNTSL